MSSNNLLHFPDELRAKFEPYLPPRQASDADDGQRQARPFVTLTYAMSLDSMIAAAPGTQTVLSGQASKAMTHYLRTRHDAICVGAGTAIADNPTLNSRLSDASGNLHLQPRPVVLDRRARWRVSKDSKVVHAAANGRGKGPWLIVDPASQHALMQEQLDALEASGGEILTGAGSDLPTILQSLKQRGINSIMIEGGSEVIRAMLGRHEDLIDSLIVTIAPVFLGCGGVNIAPLQNSRLKLADTTWIPLDADVVTCNRVIQTQ